MMVFSADKAQIAQAQPKRRTHIMDKAISHAE